ncbi:MAG: hypothetical protein AMXMBFR4_28620 [Candidatus Hydrogenedentota bacterium]
MQVTYTCPCGHRMTISEFAIGMTLTCPVCGREEEVSASNVKPVRGDEPKPTPVSPPPSERPAPQPDHEAMQCARCGRMFKGSWDRHPSPIGTVCNVCRSFVVNQNVEIGVDGYVAPVESIRIDPVEEARQVFEEESDEEAPWWERYRPDPQMMQRIAIGAGVTVILLTIYYWITDSGMPTPEEFEQLKRAQETGEGPELGKWAETLIRAPFRYISTVLGLYIFLYLGKRLPQDSVIANIIGIAPIALVVMIISLFPCIGWLLIFLVVFVSFGFETSDIINLPIAFVLAGILAWCFETLAVGVAAMILT